MKDALKLQGCRAERLITETEAAEYLGLSDRTNAKGSLRWLMRSRKLAYVRLAKGIYGFRRSDLDVFIESRRVCAADER